MKYRKNLSPSLPEQLSNTRNTPNCSHIQLITYFINLPPETSVPKTLSTQLTKLRKTSASNDGVAYTTYQRNDQNWWFFSISMFQSKLKRINFDFRLFCVDSWHKFTKKHQMNHYWMHRLHTKIQKSITSTAIETNFILKPKGLKVWIPMFIKNY